MTPFLVSHYAVDEIFPKVAGYLAKAISRHSALTVPDLARMCSNRGAWLFVDDALSPKHALVGLFDVRQGEPVFHIVAMAGEGRSDWLDAMPQVEQFAQRFGAKAVTFESHTRAFERLMPQAKIIGYQYRIEV